MPATHARIALFIIFFKIFIIIVDRKVKKCQKEPEMITESGGGID
jgi:hypothetical protein